MIRLVNRNTGGDMWVHENRLDEYLAAGHRLAAPPAPKHPLAAAEPTSKRKTKK